MNTPTFSRDADPPSRDHTITLRVTEEDDMALTATADRLGIAKSELVRKALDFWFQNSPEARSRRR